MKLLSHAQALACILWMLSCTASPPPRTARPVEARPCPSWAIFFKAHPTPIRVHLLDDVSLSPTCARGKTLSVLVSLDGQSLGTVDMPCLVDEISAPGRSYPLEGPVVSPGTHELRVVVRAPRGVFERTATVSLPAFDVSGDGQVIQLGAEIGIEVSDGRVGIDPPRVLAPRGL